MTGDDLGTALVLVWFAFIACSVVWSKFLRGRDPRSLVITTTYQGSPATAVRGRNSCGPAAVICGVIAAPFMVAGLFAWWSTNKGLVVLLVPGVYFGILAWLIATGRMGDGTVWFTRDGLSQRASGLEQGMRWDDMVAMRLARDGVELDSSAPIKAHRYGPRAWVGRSRSVDPMMKLLMGNIPRVYLVQAIDRWVTDEFARLEIGTPEAVERLLGPGV